MIMNTILTIVSYILVGALGYVIGYYQKKHKVESILIDKQIFFENQSKKQAAMIDELNNRLEYFTVSEIYQLSEYLEENEFDEDQVLLGLVYPFEKTNTLL